MGQTGVSQRVPMTSRWDLMQLQALRLQHPDVRAFQGAVEGTYPVAWMGGRPMVGFVGALLSGAEAMGYEAMSAWAPAVRVGSRSGAVVSFRVDIDHLDVLEALPLAQWHLAAMAAPDLEKARYGTRVDSVQAGLGLPQAYTGEGVLIGVLDWGFDYTHPMFYDSLLNASRVRAVWDQYRQVGPGPADFGYGRVAEEPSDIASLASDTANIYGFAYHGTHVAGIAGGAGAGTALVGMAPGAELVFTTFLIDEAAAMDAFAWMQDIAEADGKRLVINNSWSLPEFGTRDGQGLFNQFIDSMSEEGVVFVASAGNNGSKDYHIAHAFSGDILRSRVQFYPESANPNMWGQALTLWGEAGASFEAGIALTSMGSNIVHESPWFSTADGPMMLDTALVFEGDTLPVELIVEEAHPANGRPFIRMRVRKSGSSLGGGTAGHGAQRDGPLLEYDAPLQRGGQLGPGFPITRSRLDSRRSAFRGADAGVFGARDRGGRVLLRVFESAGQRRGRHPGQFLILWADARWAVEAGNCRSRRVRGVVHERLYRCQFQRD